MSSPWKLIVFTAPSGSGKTTIVRHVLSAFPDTAFSVSATTRVKRPHELHAKDYYYLSVDTFKSWIDMDAFAEWEEVYVSQFYGTPKSEIERLWACQKHVVLDMDVNGAMNIKKLYPKETMTIFIKVPSIEVLEKRLRLRGNDTEESLERRLSKAQYELTLEPQFDAVLVNDDLHLTLKQAENIVQKVSTFKLMQALTTNGVRIGVESNFQPGHSFPHRNQYLHVYTVHIQNYNDFSVQLISRHWDITEADGTKKVVDGPGVVGEQPLLEAGGIHSYSSFCVLAFAIGRMSGYYTMIRTDTGEQFNVDIPAFNLVMPDTLN